MQEYVEGANAAWTEKKSMQKGRASLGNKRYPLPLLNPMYLIIVSCITFGQVTPL